MNFNTSYTLWIISDVLSVASQPFTVSEGLNFGDRSQPHSAQLLVPGKGIETFALVELPPPSSGSVCQIRGYVVGSRIPKIHAEASSSEDRSLQSRPTMTASSNSINLGLVWSNHWNLDGPFRILNSTRRLEECKRNGRRCKLHSTAC